MLNITKLTETQNFSNKFPAIVSVGQQLPSKTHKHTQSINNGVIELSRCFPTACSQGINLHPFWEKENKQANEELNMALQTQHSTEAAWIKLNYIEKHLELM